MSVILDYGNIFHVVAEYETYVDYRVTDPTLNGWNYEPIFAARWVEPTIVIPPPRVAYRPLDYFVRETNNSVGAPELSQGTTPPLSLIDTDVPEPGYSMLIGLILAVISLRLRRMTLRKIRVEPQS